MQYISTRNKANRVSSAYAITNGISAEGGLFVPEDFPQLTPQRLLELSKMGYAQRAQSILAEYLTDFTEDELYHCVSRAYRAEKFGGEGVTKLSKLGDSTYMLELWHGPTCAFKDMALQLLPQLMTVSAKKCGAAREIVILVATSGDTGKAALEGFKDVPGTKIMVFYPQQGVSAMQRLQMVTQEGGNVAVCGVQGNFDDAQTAVKQIFTDPQLAQKLREKESMFSSANSINWGRLAPQLVYYISAYCDLLADEEIALGDPVNVCVPTGNFGNILAAYYAKQMGLPVAKLICASNENNVLTEFLRTGAYNRRRPFHTTLSPSMDILISSNLERLLFALSEQDDQVVAGMMAQLNSQGAYTVTDQAKQRLQADFYGGCCTDAQTLEEIGRTFREYSYLCDTHTAVALGVCRQYVRETGDNTKTIVASTANPYKFPASVLEAVTGEKRAEDEFLLAQELERLSGTPMPSQLKTLREKPARFDDVCDRESIQAYTQQKLGL